MTLPDSPLYLFPHSRAAGWSCLSAAAAEAAEWVRGRADLVPVGAGRCCAPNVRAERDNSADQYFRDHVLSRHVILSTRNEAVVRLDTENSAQESECFTAGTFRRPLCYLT